MSLPLVVINADDFGISAEVTRETAQCFQAGRISSTSILANLPGFQEACAVAQDRGFADRVGVHLNLTFGHPLSEGARSFCRPDGQLAFDECRFHAPREVTHAVYSELRAQVARVVEAGIRPTHLDSHQHIINGLPYSRMAIQVAAEFGIRRMRLTRNAFYRRSPLKAATKQLYNAYLRAAGMRTVKTFTDVKPYFDFIQNGGKPFAGPIELMCHPGKSLDGAIYGVSSETELLLSPGFARFLETVQLVSYAVI